MSNLNDELTKKQIYQELQSIRDLCKKTYSKIANFSKFEIYDNEIQIKSSEDNKDALNKMVGKFSNLMNTKNIENFVDFQKFESSNTQNKKLNYDIKSNVEIHNINIKNFMELKKINNFDIKKGLKLRLAKDKFEYMILPDNMLDMQNEGKLFYYIITNNDEYKVPYIYNTDKDHSYWIANDNNLYYIDDNNKFALTDKKGINHHWIDEK